MQRLRVGAAIMMALSLAMGVMGTSEAQASGTYETRADFIYQLDIQLGIQPVYPATPDFQDVSPSNPYYGYIEAAYQLGITNGIGPGVFGPTFGITRAEAAKYLVIAFGAGSTATNITTTSFKDNADIPSALVGYVGAAAQLKLMLGYPNGYFYPDNNLSLAQESYLIKHLVAAMSAVSLKLSASTTDAAPGQLVTLSAKGVTATGASVPEPGVTYSATGANASDVIISGNTFAATTPGSYTVQGAYGGATGTVSISVFGAAAGLKVVPPQSVVANGASSETVQVEVVDALGNVVANSSDEIGLRTDSNAALGLTGASGSVDPAGTTETAVAVNGVAAFSAQSGIVAGAVTNLTASDQTTGTIPSAAAAVTSVAQVPTSIALTSASPYIDANGSTGTDTLSAVVNDQTGYPMISESYTVAFSASGPGTFPGGSTAAGVYYGPSQAPATATLGDVQGSTGTVTVTASATGVTSASATITAVIAGAPNQIAVSKAQSITADESATYTVTVEDSHGYPVPWGSASSPATIDLAASDASVVVPASVTFTGQASQSFTISDTTAGSYTLTASDPTGALSSGTSSLTVAAGAVAGVSVAPSTDLVPIDPTLWLPTSSPTASVTAQLTDDHGNPVAESGVAVDLYLLPNVGSSNTGSASLTSGTNTVSSSGTTRNIATYWWGTLPAYGPLVAYTNSSGAATATLQLQPYVGDQYFVQADVLNGAQYADTGIFTLAQNIPAQNLVSVTSGGNPISLLTAGTTYQGTVTQKDSNGNPVDVANLCAVKGSPPSDAVTLTLGGTGSASISGPAGVSFDAATGVATVNMCVDSTGNFSITAGHAGSLTISSESVDVYGTQPETFSYSVSPGTSVAAIGFSSSGTEVTQTAPVTVAAGQNVAVTVSPLDGGGNPIVAPSPVPVSFSVNGGTGEIRNSPTGPNLPADYTTILAGQTGSTFYFVNSTSATEQVWFSGGPGAISITSPGTVEALSANTAYFLTWTLTSGGNPVAGATVDLSAAATNGTAVAQLSESSAVTNSQGQVTVSATTPNTWSSGDTNAITLTVPNTALSIAATLEDATPTSISSNADAGATYVAGSTTQVITFTVMSSLGTPVPAGIPVNITTTAGGSNTGTWGVATTDTGAGASSLSLTTDATGQVSLYLSDVTAGDTGTVTATVPGFAAATDTTGTLTIAALTVASPGTVIGQSASTGYTLTWNLTSGGQPVSGVPVTFSIAAQNGTNVAQLSTLTGTTGANGQVSVVATTPANWTSGNSDTVTLTTGGRDPQTSTATLQSVVPTGITSNADFGMGYTAGSAQTITFTVTASGNPVGAGVPVSVTESPGGSNTGTWGISSTQGGAGQSGLSLTTDALGQVSVYVTDTKAGDTGTVTATATGYPAVTDTTGTITIGPGGAAQIVPASFTSNGGNYQAGAGGALTFTIEDAYGNAVGAGATVQLIAVPNGTPGGTWAIASAQVTTGVTEFIPTTNASGQVSVYLTDTKAGDSGYVYASVGSATGDSGTFTITAGPVAILQVAGPATQQYNAYPDFFPNDYTYSWQVTITDAYGNPVYGLASLSGRNSNFTDFEYYMPIQVSDTSISGAPGYAGVIVTNQYPFPNTNVYDILVNAGSTPVSQSDSAKIMFTQAPYPSVNSSF